MPQIVYGTDGNDTLSGQPGDTLAGGRGDDTYIIYDSTTRVSDFFDAGNGGYDRVFTFVSFDQLNASIEYLSTATHSDTTPINLTGSGPTEIIVGNYGDNIITGGGGNETLIGLRGNDTYYVSQNDRVVENAGEGFDSVYANTSYTLAADASVEFLGAVPGTTVAINLTGNSFAQTIVGSSGNNIINGGGGIDTLIGLGGDDIYRVYGSSETIVEAVGGGNDTVYTSGNFYLAENVSIETLSAAVQGASSTLYLLGNSFDQRIIGDYGNNTLNGGGSRGGDTLIGLLGDDTYRIFGQNDVVVEDRGQGNDVVYTSGNYRLAAGVEVETLSTYLHSSTVAINLTGNAFDNTIIGNYGTNILDGGGGSDTLIGLEGADVFRFTAAPVRGSVTTIRDYGNGSDIILLDSKVFTALGNGDLPSNALAYGASATDADDRIVYNAATGALSYDADGNGAGAMIQFAQLATGIAQSDLRITVASIPPGEFVTSTPGTYLIGNATGSGTVIPSSVTTVTFNADGSGSPLALVFGADTSNGLVPSIKFTSAGLLTGLDFSQLQQGLVTYQDQGYSTAAGQFLLGEPPAPTAPSIIGTAFDDIIDRMVSGGYGAGTVSGGAGNDFIRGVRVADGGAGNDHLFGTVSTTLTGGAGFDLFDLPIRTRLANTNSGSAPNIVTDFNPREDAINLVLNYAGGLVPVDVMPGPLSAGQFHIGTGPDTAEQRFNYNPETGDLSFWTRGNAFSPSGEIVLFAKLPPHLDLSASNFTVVAP